MNEADTIELLQRAIMTVLIVAGPAVMSAMLVGIVVALIQALTQVQEMTLTFVPKIIAMFGAIALSAPYMGGKIYAFTEEVYAKIVTGF